jgi:hypothetical protein
MHVTKPESLKAMPGRKQNNSSFVEEKKLLMGIYNVVLFLGPSIFGQS